MTLENFDEILLTSMNNFYSDLYNASEDIDEANRLQRESTGLRGWVKILFKNDGMEEVTQQRAELEQITTRMEYFLGKAKGAVYGIKDFIRDSLPPDMADAVLEAASKAVNKYISNHERKYGFSVPDPKAFVSGLGKAIETEMYKASQKYLTGG